MMFLEKLLNRFYVMVVRLQKEGEPEQILFCGIWKGRQMTVKQEKISEIGGMSVWWNYPVIVVFSGYGVIQKEYREKTELIDRVEQGCDFLWETEILSVEMSRTCFIRREIVESYVEGLKMRGVSVVDVRLMPEPDTGAVGQIIVLFCERIRSWKYWWSTDEVSNRLALMIVRKLMWPLLAGSLMLAAVNVPLQRSVERRYICQEQKLAGLKRIEVRQASEAEITGRMIREFGAGRKISFLADRVAALVPEGIALDILVVNPLRRSPEKLKPLLQQEKYMELEGHTSKNELAASLAGNLSAADPVWRVKLIRLDEEKEKGVYVFRIGIEL